MYTTIKNIMALAAAAAAAIFFAGNAFAQDKVDYTSANNESAVMSQMGDTGDYYRLVAEIEDPTTGRAVAHVLAQKRQTDWVLFGGAGADYIRDQFAPVASLGLKYRGVRVEAGFQGGISTLEQVSSSDLAGERYLSYQAKAFVMLPLYKSKDIYKRHRFSLYAEASVRSNRFYQKIDETIIETDTEIIKTENGFRVKGYNLGFAGGFCYENMLSPKKGILFGIKAGVGYARTFNRATNDGYTGHKDGVVATGEIYFGVLLNKTKKSPLYYELMGADFNKTNNKVNEMRGAAQGK